MLERIKRFLGFNRGRKSSTPSPPPSYPDLISHEQPVCDFKNIKVYDFTKVMGTYVYFNTVEKHYEPLPEESVKNCVNKLVEYLSSQFRKSVPLEETFEACESSSECFIVALGLLYKHRRIVAQKRPDGRIHLKLLGMRRRPPTQVVRIPSHRHEGITVVTREHKEIFERLAEEEKKRRLAALEG